MLVAYQRVRPKNPDPSKVAIFKTPINSNGLNKDLCHVFFLGTLPETNIAPET